MLDVVRKTLAGLELQDETMIVAVSGGADSLVLLHTLAALQDEFGYQLHVATFDHGWRGESGAEDAAYVQKFAAQMGLPVSVGKGSLPQGSVNLEEAARQARYTFLLETALAQDAYFIAVGHHRDDQIETVLMHLLRGSGLAGLRGMVAIGNLSTSHLSEDADASLFDAMDSMTLLRPLLHLSRQQIKDYAEQHGLNPREDATNYDTRFLRNRIRQELLPTLERLNPRFQETLMRSILAIQGDYQIVDDVVIQTAAELVEWGETTNGEVAYLDRREYLGLSEGLQRQILRHVIFDLTPGLRDMPFERIEETRAFIRSGITGQQMSLPADLILTIGYDDFTVHYGGDLPFPRHIPHMDSDKVIPIDPAGENMLGDNQRFYSYWVIDGRSPQIVRDDPLEATLAVEPDAQLALRTRRNGDRFYPLGLAGQSQKLSHAFINLKIPRALRDRVPVLTVNGEIAWFVAPTAYGLQGRVAEPFAVKPDSRHILRVRWEIQED